ncbi:MAG TPA: subclass B3 metallo-beta-lactamase [Chryseolinea sp.]|nr:subclass B3 metallo-beta-lactamase [Chryseolinea sp.]
MIKSKLLLLTLIITSLANLAFAQKVSEPQNRNPQWSQPYAPFRIVGNLYYVGTYDLACYLIVTPEGNILINTGLAASASLINDNIKTLGFKLADTKILLTTQAHYDHVAAMAAIKQQTGAKLMADTKDAAALEDGGSSDYELGKYGKSFEPVHVDRRLQNGDTIKLGNMRLVMLHHPGHTKGSSSYLFDVKDERKTYRVLIVNMPSIITDRKFSGIQTYPDIAKDYAYTLDALKKLSFDLWLSSHASQFALHSKHKPGDAYNPEAFSDRKEYEKSVADLETQYRNKMKAEQ